jgi:hypothetical protein
MPLDDFENEDIWRDARTHFSNCDLSPEVVAEQLAEWVPSQVKKLFGQDIPADAERWVATLATACCYGPTDAGLPPSDLVKQLVEWAAFPKPGDQRAVERILVFGILDRNPKETGWAGEWDGAWNTFGRYIRSQIYKSVRRISEWLVFGDKRNPAVWAISETKECAPLLAWFLVRGCRCWERWDDFHVESKEAAQAICTERHHLNKWDRTTPLRYFLRTASVEMGFPNVNSFRKGMLAKYVVSETLVAGKRLRCLECEGEIATNNLCDCCKKHEPRERPDWWMWPKGQRVLWYCKRCGHCQRLSFVLRADGSAVVAANKSGMTCTTCGHGHWQPRMTEVWARVACEPATEWNLKVDAPVSDEDLESWGQVDPTENSS